MLVLCKKECRKECFAKNHGWSARLFAKTNVVNCKKCGRHYLSRSRRWRCSFCKTIDQTNNDNDFEYQVCGNRHEKNQSCWRASNLLLCSWNWVCLTKSIILQVLHMSNASLRIFYLHPCKYLLLLFTTYVLNTNKLQCCQFFTVLLL